MITEEEFIDFKCPFCKAAVSFPQADVGFVRMCPTCNEDLIVPENRSEFGLKLPLPIKTPNLILRRFAPGDWKDLMGCLPDAEEDSVLRWIETDSQVRLANPEPITFYLGIELQSEGKLIGFLGLQFADSDRLQASLGISSKKSFEGTEFEMEAVGALFAFCFEGIKLHRVTARSTSRVDPQCRLFEQVGMRYEGESIKNRFVNGEWVNSVWYAMLAEEYLNEES